MARQAQGDVEREKKELEDSFQRVSEQAQRKVSRGGGGHTREEQGLPMGHLCCQPLPLLQSQEQAEMLETLKRELAASRQELQVLQGTLESITQVRAPSGLGSQALNILEVIPTTGLKTSSLSSSLPHLSRFDVT